MNVRIKFTGGVDVPKLLERSDRRNKRVLFRAGAYARTVMRNSMRRRKGVSPPGTPPNAHVGTLKRLISFAVDTTEQSVVAGPEIFSGKGTTRTNKTIPDLMDSGGAALIDTVSGKDRQVKKQPAVFVPRPFVDPALEKSADKLADLIATEPL